MQKIFSFFKRWYINFTRGFKLEWPEHIINLLPLLLTFSSFLVIYEKNTIIKVAFIIILLLAMIVSVAKKGEIILTHEEELAMQKDKYEEKVASFLNEQERLRDSIEFLTQSLESLPDDFLQLIFYELKMTNSDRISLYTHIYSCFYKAGRYASVEPLNTRGRDKYPDKEGYISLAWKEDDLYIKDLPNYDENPEEYLRVVKKNAHIKKSTLRAMSMHSRSFYVKIIREENRQPIGIIVIESLNPQLPISVDEINTMLESLPGKHLTSLIKYNRPGNEQLEKGDRNGNK